MNRAKRLFHVAGRDTPADAVYIGRPGPWGNPFRIGPDGSRKNVVGQYRLWLAGQHELRERMVRELKGRVLKCWCHPEREACHGEIILEVVDGTFNAQASEDRQAEQLGLFG